MERYEREFAEVLVSDQEKWHDFYYLCDLDEEYSKINDALLYRLHRAGLDPKLPKLFYIERKNASEYSILNFVFSGRGSVTYKNKTYSVQAGDLYILPAGIAHAYKSNPNEPMGQIWIEIDGGDSEKILKSVVDELGPILHDEVSKKIGAKMSFMIQKIAVHEYYDIAVLIYRILLDLIFEKNNISGRDRAEKTSRIQLVKSYIDAHISENITNDELAKLSGLSRSYFMKMFKERYKLSPQEYIMQQRIESAKHFLTHSDKSVDELAFQFCFCTTSHFIKRFKNHVGMTPAQYRKNGYVSI